MKTLPEEFEIKEKFQSAHERAEVVRLISSYAEAFDEIERTSLDAWLKRIGDARIVLLGECTHGTSEFYKMRSYLTQELILRKGFNIVAIEADWPDVEHLNRFVRHLPRGRIEKKVFTRFPSWMWKNAEFHSFLLWLRQYNSRSYHADRPVNLFGLDFYSLYQSIDTLVQYLDKKDQDLGQLARKQYEPLRPWKDDASQYGWAVAIGKYKECEDEVTSILSKLLEEYASERLSSDEEFMHIFQNASSIANAEEYYRTMYRSSASSWNLRDRHMFETLETILALQGENSKAVIWAHNSHIGNAAATESAERGEINLGQLCKDKYGDASYLIGFGTHKGTVAAARSWGAEVEIKEVKASYPQSMERLFHESQVPSFFLPFQGDVKDALTVRLLQRAIGVVYLPDQELESHYFTTVPSYQFDEYIWFDHTHAVTPLSLSTHGKRGETYPFGL